MSEPCAACPRRIRERGDEEYSKDTLRDGIVLHGNNGAHALTERAHASVRVDWNRHRIANALYANLVCGCCPAPVSPHATVKGFL